MGVDFGERRTGVALSDPTGTLASPLQTIRRRPGQRLPVTALESLARVHNVTAIVVGVPLSLRGADTEWTRRVRTAGEELARRLQVPVGFVDERFTSVQAERAIRAAGHTLGEPEHRARVDRVAAAVILQTWLDRRSDEVR
ncbi:MAG: Holliday junction resolvase RuvX [Gemmatimonadota bacterium]|nr:Holliday junction resolvase RuvX [Gemmatimonadota bacterium]